MRPMICYLYYYFYELFDFSYSGWLAKKMFVENNMREIKFNLIYLMYIMLMLFNNIKEHM